MKKLIRKKRLYNKILTELKNSNPNVDKIISYVDDYEIDNLKTIKQLRKDRVYDIKRINGGLRQTIDAHGPITKLLIGSASKRILGALLTEKPNKKLNFKWFFMWLVSVLICTSIMITII